MRPGDGDVHDRLARASIPEASGRGEGKEKGRCSGLAHGNQADTPWAAGGRYSPSRSWWDRATVVASLSVQRPPPVSIVSLSRSKHAVHPRLREAGCFFAIHVDVLRSNRTSWIRRIFFYHPSRRGSSIADAITKTSACVDRHRGRAELSWRRKTRSFEIAGVANDREQVLARRAEVATLASISRG